MKQKRKLNNEFIKFYIYNLYQPLLIWFYKKNAHFTPLIKTIYWNNLIDLLFWFIIKLCLDELYKELNMNIYSKNNS